MNRSVVIYAALLAVSLVGAYLSWTHEPTTDSASGVVVDRFPASQIRGIQWEDEKKSLQLDVRKDDRGRYVWVTDGDGAYKASGAVDRLFEDLDPMRAARRLTDPSDKKLELFGLDDPKRKLVLELAGDKTRRFDIGAHSYGRRHVYMQDAETGRYYVVKSSLLSPLRFADTRLVERSVVGLKERDIRTVTVESPAGDVSLHQHNLDDPTAAYWSLGDEKSKNKSASSWIGKLLRVQVETYVTDERPEGLTPALTVRVETTEGPPLTVELFEKPNGDKPALYYADSPFNRSFVQLKHSGAASLVDDLGTLTGSDPPPEVPKPDATAGGNPDAGP